MARWLELLAFGVYVYDLTKSPLLVTVVTLVKFAPLALFGPIAGTLPARFSARKLYLAGISMMLAVTLAGLLYSLQHSPAVWQILLVSFIGGVFWVLDFPVRRKMLGDAVAPDVLSRAVGLDTLANNGTRLLGPMLGGSLLQYTGLPGVLALNLVLYGICLVATLQLPLGAAAERDVSGNASPDTLLGNLREGVAVIAGQPVLISTLLVTVIFNLFGFPMLSLVPVLGREELNLSASVIGVLASMEGAGALVGGVLFLVYGQISLFRRIYVLGVAGCLIFWLVAAASDNVYVMAGALWLVGISSACFAVMQTTLLILNCEYRFRSRVFGILSLSIGAGLIGFSQTGLFASWLGPRAALVLSSIMGLIALLAVCLRWPQILARQPT